VAILSKISWTKELRTKEEREGGEGRWLVQEIQPRREDKRREPSRVEIPTGHGLVGDTSVWVDLLEHTVNVGRICFLSGLLWLLLLTGSLSWSLSSRLLSGSWGFSSRRGWGFSGDGSRFLFSSGFLRERTKKRGAPDE